MTLTFARRPLALSIAFALGTAGADAATITITDGTDLGTASTCTLRQAIASANSDDAGASSCIAGSGNDTIMFDASLAGVTVTLSQGQLDVTAPLTISGNGQTLDAAGGSRVFNVVATSLTAGTLTLTGGAAPPGGDGGGVFGMAGTITFTNTTISGNFATNGGGVYAAAGTLTLTNCMISGNTSALNGGGIFAGNGATLTLGNDTISGNIAGNHGGGVSGAEGTIAFANSAISGNGASQGGGFSGSGGSVQVTDALVSGNTATLNAGGVYSTGGNLTLTNTTVSGNSGGEFGGGVSSVQGTLTLTNTTVAGNTATMAGGVGSASNTITFANTILADNGGGDCSSAGNDTLVANNTLVSDPASACGIGVGGANGNIVGQDPMLGPLADNGGPTMTMMPDATSPALNAGSVALAMLGGAPLNFDQRGFGFPRTLDGMVDIGAYQHQGDRLAADGFEPQP